MSGQPRQHPSLHRRVLGSGAIAALIVVAAVGPAWAHGSEESTEAGALVRQAIALIVNTPNDRMAIEDKVGDALDSKVPDGVDLDAVRQARIALAGGDLHRVRTLLEQSIGARPHLGVTEVMPIRQTTGPDTAGFATGAESGTNVVIDPLSPRRRFDAGMWIALAGATAIALGGTALARRYRPPVPLQSLRATARPQEA